MGNRIYRTKKNELVDSNYERLVANFLYEHDINYEHAPDYHLAVSGKYVAPDFYLPDYDLYIEVYGMAGVPEYDRGLRWKRNQYDMDDIRLIELWPKGGRLNFRYLIKKRFENLTGKRFPQKKRVPYFPPDKFPIFNYS